MPEPHSSPEISLGPLGIWVHGRQLPDATDFDDANWLRVSAHCASRGASVRVSGSFLQTMDLQRWLNRLGTLHSTLAGTAHLEPLEPDLLVHVSAGSLGQLEIVVRITPDHLAQAHSFSFTLDQTFIPPVLKQLEAVLQRFPVIGAPVAS